MWYIQLPDHPRVTQFIISGPFESARKFVNFIINSRGISAYTLVQCLRAYSVPYGCTDKQLLDLIRATREDLPSVDR